MIKLEFTQRNVDVPADLRLYRRLAMVCISAHECCKGSAASFKQLHFINSLYLDLRFREIYFEYKSRRITLKILTPSADPYLNRCVNYALGIGLLAPKPIKSSFKLMLSDSGKQFVANLKSQNLAEDIFAISQEIGKISETEINNALRIG
jgi:hypothetical protein